MNNYDVIIIGAGPGGIFGAYELIEKNPDCKIAVFEAGHELAKRKCPIDGKKIKSCISCKSCSIMSGFGGAGATFADIELFAKHIGPNVKMKAAGGISSIDDAEKFLALGADRLGTSRIVKIVKNEEATGY